VEGILESAERKGIIKRVFAKVTSKEVGGRVVRMSLMSRSSVESTSADGSVMGTGNSNGLVQSPSGERRGDAITALGIMSTDSQEVPLAGSSGVQVSGKQVGGSSKRAASYSARPSLRSSRMSIRSESQQQQQHLLYTFLDKRFREGVYKLMLETQRQAVHLVIAESLEENYDDTAKAQADQAEALAFHFSRANHLEKNIQYSVEAARLFRERFMPMTAMGFMDRIVMLCTDQRDIIHIIQNAYPQKGPGAKHTRNGIIGNFGKACRRPEDFGSALVGKRFLDPVHFQSPVLSHCSLISNAMYSSLVGELSAMHYS
jgi:hypothetical protein